MNRIRARCFSLQPMTAYRPVLDGTPSLAASWNKMLMRAATVVQVLQDLFYVLLHVLFYLWSLLKFWSMGGGGGRPPGPPIAGSATDSGSSTTIPHLNMKTHSSRTPPPAHPTITIFQLVRPFDLLMVPWKFRDDISNGTRVIMLTDKHPNKQTHKQT